LVAAGTPQRVVVIGVSGAGKSTFARAVAARIGAPSVEMDALHWEPGWQAVPPETFLARMDAATAGDRWVADGNYSRARTLVWPRADTIVWLDFPFRVVLPRLLWRQFSRLATGATVCNGNRERFSTFLFSRDSLLLWQWQTFPKYRREFPPALAAMVTQGVATHRLTSPAAAQAWLASLGDGQIDAPKMESRKA
jgi:adenylate kinase family enzyme